MTTTTFLTKTFPSATTPSVGDAFRQLLSALVASLPSANTESLKSATDEANQVRDMAFDYLATDPGYAEDLFAAADRHERAHGVSA